MIWPQSLHILYIGPRWRQYQLELMISYISRQRLQPDVTLTGMIFILCILAFSCIVQRGKNKMRKYSWQCFFFLVCLILIFPWGLLILFNNCAISIARHWPIALILPGQERAAYGQLWRAIHVVSCSLDRLSTEDEKCTDCYADFFFFSTIFYFSFN